MIATARDIQPLAEDLSALAEEALLQRLRTVVPSTYTQTLRALRAYASVSMVAAGPLVQGISLSQPALHIRLRKELGITTALEARRWLAGNGDQVPAEWRDALLPVEVVAAVAEMLRLGPAKCQDRLEQFADELAQREYVPTAGARRDGQEGLTLAAIGNYTNPILGMTTVLVRLRRTFEHSDALRRWDRRLDAPYIETNPRAGERARAAATVASVRAQIEHLDAMIAKPFAARSPGATDLSLLKDGMEDFFTEARGRPMNSLRDRQQRFVRQYGLVSRARDRALVLLMAETSLRPVVVVDLQVRDYTSILDRPFLVASPGVRSLPGGVFAKAAKNSRRTARKPPRWKPLSRETCDRIDFWLWVYSTMTGLSIEEMAELPLLPSKLHVKSGPDGPTCSPTPYESRTLSVRFVGQSLTRARRGTLVGHVPLCPEDLSVIGMRTRDLEGVTSERLKGPGGYGLRRFADQTVWAHGNTWVRRNPDVSAEITGTLIKEALLDHQQLPGDPYGYTGLREAEALVLLSYYGSQIISEAIFGELAKKRGPDPRRVREARMILDGIERHVDAARAARRSAIRKVEEAVSEASPTDEVLSLLARLVVDENRVEELLLTKHEWTTRLAELMADESLWVVLPESDTPLTWADLRAFSDRETRRGHAALAPRPRARDFLLQRELADIFNVSSETIRRWRADDARSERSRPWPRGAAPMVLLDSRTPLVHPGGLLPSSLTEDRRRLISAALERFPDGPEWEASGAKRKRLESRGLRLSESVKRLNDLGLDHDGAVLADFIEFTS